jgi:hypothetical protein
MVCAALGEATAGRYTLIGVEQVAGRGALSTPPSPRLYHVTAVGAETPTFRRYSFSTTQPVCGTQNRSAGDR